MLYYREHQWMLVPGRSRFTVDIDPEHRTPEDVEWRMEIHFVAAGDRLADHAQAHRGG